MSQPQVVFGAGHVHITQVSDANGNKIIPPQVIAAPAVQNVSADFGKSDVKQMYGQSEFSIHAAQGKKTTEVSFECGEIYANLLNQLYFGQSVTAGSHVMFRDQTGVVIPESYSTNIKISNKKTFNLGKVTANTSVTIAGVAATVSTSTVITTGKYKYANGLYSFSLDDAGKTAQLTYTVLGGVTVVSTLKIPKSGLFNTFLFSKTTLVAKTGVVGYFTNIAYSQTSAVPAVAEYQTASNGVYIFNSAEAVSVTITHTTHGVSVSSLVAALPAAGYITIIDPPASSVFVQDNGVLLLSNSGTAMTGVTVGNPLAVNAAPISGQYTVTNGMYTFAAADAGDTVTAYYTTDYEYFTMKPPGDGNFIADKGVRNQDGMPFTRVALTTPVSLLYNQYAMSDNGAYYFDITNNGDRVYIDYEYESTAGATLAITNNEMGSTPIVSLDISGKAEGQEWLIKYPRAVPKAFGFATKMDDFSMYKITFEVIADRVSDLVGTVYMAA